MTNKSYYQNKSQIIKTKIPIFKAIFKRSSIADSDSRDWERIKKNCWIGSFIGLAVFFSVYRIYLAQDHRVIKLVINIF